MSRRTPSALSDSWTDDLRVCPFTGIGISTNVIYRHNGQPTQEHQMENTSIRFKYDDDTWLYGVFDGHDRNTVAEFASQKMSAELLLGQLNGKMTEDEIKHLLCQAFASVERDYFASIGDKLAKRTELLLQLPDNIYEAHQLYPEIVMELDSIQQQITSGASAVVALIYRGKLYVANVGDCRALLCRTDEFGSVSVSELTVRHDTNNSDEVLRLTGLGLSESTVAYLNHTTRCLGDFPRKGGYKDFDFLKEATSEPVIADADAVGGIDFNDSCRFIILTTSSVCKALEDATGTAQVNRDLAALVLKEFSAQSTINGVAQAVVDEISRRHYDAFVGDTTGTVQSDRSFQCRKREDMTLLIRNFNQPLASPTSTSTPSFASFVSGGARTLSESSYGRPIMNEDTWTMGNTSSTDWSTIDDSPRQEVATIPLDENNRIAAYVDFGEFYEALRKMETTSAEIRLQRQSSDIVHNTGDNL